MQASSQFLLTIGGILLVGLAVSTVAQRTFLPRVTLLLLLGVAIGPEMLDVIPAFFSERFDLIADMTLLVVGFLIGGKLTRKAVYGTALQVFWIATVAALATAALVALALLTVAVPPALAVLLGCIAAATAPAAILDVVYEVRQQSRFSQLLIAVVAFDDILALVLFAVGVSVVGSLHGAQQESFFLVVAFKEIGGAILLGVALGLPAAFMTGRIKPGQPVLTEALAIVFVCGGLAIWLEVSHLIAAMMMGATIANFARHHEYPFHAIEGVESLFMVIFFVLAGASLEISALQHLSVVGVVYILARTAGKYVGARLGCRISTAPAATRQWMGVALLPQAGVAIGMALVAASLFPQYRQVLLPVVISSTIFFDLIGPVFTRFALKRVGPA